MLCTYSSRIMTISPAWSKASCSWRSLEWWSEFIMSISCRTCSFWVGLQWMNLAAQFLFVARSMARWTTPNAPRPSSSQMMYLPRTSPRIRPMSTWSPRKLESSATAGNCGLSLIIQSCLFLCYIYTSWLWWINKHNFVEIFDDWSSKYQFIKTWSEVSWYTLSNVHQRKWFHSKRMQTHKDCHSQRRAWIRGWQLFRSRVPAHWCPLCSPPGYGTGIPAQKGIDWLINWLNHLKNEWFLGLIHI